MGCRNGFHGRAATISRLTAASRRAASQKLMAFSESLGVTYTGMPLKDIMCEKSSRATPRKVYASSKRLPDALWACAFHAVAKMRPETTMAKISSRECKGS